MVDYVEEKSLVLLDEPEEHLHPPLVAAFIRALSELLTHTNGVAVIATHSPVIVQEVPKKCVWKIRRDGGYRKFDRPKIETYGENLGEITTEIFGYDVQKSGFHALLKKLAEASDTYDTALAKFHGELGNEAKSILRAYMFDKEKSR
ncbi:MAG: ATP-binding protein [Lachnospiraceae bacterium]|nr:ATP-binding protein [Lachnospiraceae bacterium]